MNRSTALLLALAALLAHILTLHQNGAGGLGAPLDGVHVAFRMGRELVRGASPFDLAETYPSLAWIALATVAERISYPPTTLVQSASILAALGAVWVVSRFSPARLAGVIAPFLCVVSGPIASAAGGGSEFAFFTLCLGSAFLAFEHGKGGVLAASLVAASLARPEGLLVTVFFGLLALGTQAAPSRSGGRRLGWSAFGPPLLFEAVLAAGRWRASGAPLSPVIASLFAPESGRLGAGLENAGDFLLHSGGPLLVAVPVCVALLGRLGGRALRALAIAIAWTLYVAAQGGSSLPFWVEYAPALPLAFLAVQETLTQLIDERRDVFRRVAWVLFAAGMASSALASKLPADVGPLPLAQIHRAWLGSDADEGDDPLDLPRARPGVQRAVENTERLRALGAFLRDHLDPRASIASPWTGAISYLSQRTVSDLLGRSTALPGETRPRSGFGKARTDLLAAIATDADYIVPFLLAADRAPRFVPFIETWFRRYDRIGPQPKRMAAFWEHLADYELIAVPVPQGSADNRHRPFEPFFLLRHRRLAQAPRLMARVDGRAITVEVEHAGHLQIVDLEVSLQDGRGEFRSLRPTGRYALGRGVHARTNLLLSPSGERPVRLLEAELPLDFRPTHLFAVLRNPGSQGDINFSLVSNEVVLNLR